MKIKSFQGGFDNNISYLIWCESTHIAGIVDASVNVTEINESIENSNKIENPSSMNEHLNYFTFTVFSNTTFIFSIINFKIILE